MELLSKRLKRRLIVRYIQNSKALLDWINDQGQKSLGKIQT